MHAHDIKLRAPSFLGGGDSPVVLRRTDQNFIHAVLDQLKTEHGRTRLREQLEEQAKEGEPILYLPTQRAFHVVIAEAYCDVPGQPRVAPAKIRSAGVVLRRRMPIPDDQRNRGNRLIDTVKGRRKERKIVAYGPPERWLTRQNRLLGWVRAEPPELVEDPRLENRRVHRAGNTEIDRALEKRRRATDLDAGRADETTHKLHLAPPNVCEAVGATLLIGVVQPVERKVAEKVVQAKYEAAVDRDQPNELEYSETEVRAMLPGWLRHRASGVAAPIPASMKGRTFRVKDVGSGDLFKLQVQRKRPDGSWEAFTFDSPWKSGPGAGDGSQFSEKHFVRFLWQARIELKIWAGGKDFEPLRRTLEGLRVDLPGGGHRDLAAWLFDATEVFVMMEEDIEITFPDHWPLIPSTTYTAIVGQAKTALQRHLAQFTRYEHRYNRDDARYEVKAFARVRHDPQCPPDLVWSDESIPYRVARWFEGGPSDAVMPTIELPTLDRGFLKNLRPNVTIKVPRSMFNFTNNLDINKVLNGEQENDTSGPEFAWICGFNISIIFMIAFMLLITFVFMLNIVFWWVAFFRICIPLPLPRAAQGGE